jgi:hypothetical protein
MTDAMTEDERLQRALEIQRGLVIELATITADDRRLSAAPNVLCENVPLLEQAKVKEALRKAAKAGIEVADEAAVRRMARFFADAKKAKRREEQKLDKDLHKLWPERFPPVVGEIAEPALKRPRGRPPKALTQSLP